MDSTPKICTRIYPRTAAVFCLVAALIGCGGSGDHGAAVDARAQTIAFAAAPSLDLNGTANISASASSGLAVNYSTMTPTVCTVNSASGVVSAIAAGTCVIAANQAGNAEYAPAAQVTQTITVNINPNQTISFAPAPTLTYGGSATVSAMATSGLSVTYSSATASICSVDSHSGVVTDFLAGTCTVIANQAGDANYYAAPAVALDLIVQSPIVTTAPGIPNGVTVALSADGGSAIISIASTDSGGSPITSYTATSSPSGLSATSTTLPITVPCASSCTGYSFSVTATNNIGSGPASNNAEIITHYHIVTTFYEPDTQPRNSIFTGTFIFNSTMATVSNLSGLLTESMTGDPYGAPPLYGMTQLSLNYQLSSIGAGANALLVTTFRNSNTNTFWTNGGSNDGWSPEAGVDVGGIYYGFPVTSANPGNAYARIFVNTQNPVAALTQAQIDKLAYADCAPGGMMGAACMTGTSTAGYGGIGTMSGYPVSQTIVKQ